MGSKNNIELRDYQLECLDAIRKKGPGRWLVVMATGLGKTATFTRLPAPGRTLILSHRDELVRQPEEYFDDSISFGVEKAGEKAGGQKIVSASVQSLSKDSRLKRYSPDAFDTIIVDECHHASAPTYRKILGYFSGAKTLLGFTATPQRGDGMRLSDVFDEIIFIRDLRWGIEHGYLSRIRCIRVTADYDISHVRHVAGDLSQKELGAVLEKSRTISIAAKTYIEECHNSGRHTLIYCVTRAICQTLVNAICGLLPENEHDAIRMLTGETPEDERREMLKAFTRGDVRCIVNCMVLTEGTDLPICDTIMNLRPTCNPALYQQMVGRGCRLYDGKDYNLVIDVMPQNDRQGALCSAPTLFGIEPSRLSKKQKGRLNKHTDLLSLCTDISETCAEAAKTLELKIESVNLLIDEIQEIAGNTRISGFKALACDLIRNEEDKRSSQNDIDFHGLVVSVQADEATRFKITPSWNETVFISEPDILGNCKITFTLFKDPYSTWGEEEQVCSGNMRIEDAVKLTCDFCNKYRRSFAYMWDENERNRWGSSPATQKQIARAKHDDIWSDVSRTGLSSINKLEASVLIDTAMELKAAKKKKAKLEAELAAVNTNSVNDEQEHTERDASSDGSEKRFSHFVEAVQAPPRTHSHKPDADPDGKSKFIMADTTVFGKRNCAPSTAQISFLLSLADTARHNGDNLPYFDTSKMTKRQAAGIIGILKAVNGSFQGIPRCFIGIEDLIDGFEDSTPPANTKLFYTDL